MNFNKKKWRLSAWTGKPEKGQRCEFLKMILHKVTIDNYSFLKKLNLGWYTINCQEKAANTGRFMPSHPIQDAYHKHYFESKIVVDHWQGRVGDWKRIVKRVYF